MKSRLNQSGVGHLVMLLAVVVIAAVGIVGYRVMSSSDSDSDTATTSQSAVKDSSQMKTKADVQQASTELDNTSLNDVDPAQLDSDLNSIL
jgi:flagellar basal body-associated protein FliL